MNTLLWIVQAVLALLLVPGGGYKLFKSADLVSQFPAMPGLAWQALGLLELIGGILLVLPASIRFLPNHTSTVALILLVEALVLSLFYARYSTRLTAENPLMFSALMTVLLAFVAYGRYARSGIDG